MIGKEIGKMSGDGEQGSGLGVRRENRGWKEVRRRAEVQAKEE